MVIVKRRKDNDKVKWIPILVALAVMTGCASVAQKTCLQTDWQRMGYKDGIQGELASHSASQRDVCIQEGVTPDMAQYAQGRRQGLEKYCTAENGRAIGMKGGPYQGVCPQQLQGSFINAYQKGLQSYAQKLENHLKAKTDLQQKMRKELAGVEEDIAYLEEEISAATEGQARLRMGMISEMRMLEDDQQSLTLQISSLEMDLEEIRLHLSKIKVQAGSLDQ